MNYWDNKEDRAKIALSHTRQMEEKYHDDIKSCLRGTSAFSAEKDVECIKYRDSNTPNVIVTPLDTVSAAFTVTDKTLKTVILNFASYKNPGGMFLKGSKAQEECLCHESFLYNVLKDCDKYYEWNNRNKNRSLYKNRALYSKNVIFEHNGDIRRFDIITCAAPNFTAAGKYCNVSMDENLSYLRSRMVFVRNLIEKNAAECAVLGAFGCGVFGQPPKEVAGIWKEVFSQTGLKMIVYAVLGENTENYKEFKKILG